MPPDVPVICMTKGIETGTLQMMSEVMTHLLGPDPDPGPTPILTLTPTLTLIPTLTLTPTLALTPTQALALTPTLTR